MKLTFENVQAVLRDCLFKDGEDTTQSAVLVDGITFRFGFHPERLDSHKNDIKELLTQLPDNFHSGQGEGDSFLNACMSKDGDQWGEHRSVELLMCLGIASKQAEYLLPREMWAMLPGGMPMFVVRAK